MYGIAEAKPKEPVLEFYVESFKPLNNTPYGVERITKLPVPDTKTIVRKVAVKQAKNKQPAKESTPADSGRNYSENEVTQLIRQYSQQLGISSETPLCIAKHESNFNHNARNKSSSASGVFQWISSSWKSQPEGKQGLSVFDAEANIRAAVRYMAEKKSTKPWVVSSKCPQVTPL